MTGVDRLFDHEGNVAAQWASGVLAGDRLIARETTDYDARGRAWRSTIYSVDPDTGTVGNDLEGNTWYDAAGNAVKQQSAGAKAFTKSTYDGLGRAGRQYTGHDDAEALTLDGDTILQQQETIYNEAGSAVFSTTWRRMDDATGTGALSGSCPFSWPDGKLVFSCLRMLCMKGA